jgi:hypothetical protein
LIVLAIVPPALAGSWSAWKWLQARAPEPECFLGGISVENPDGTETFVRIHCDGTMTREKMPPTTNPRD